jgi:RNA polymerase primary sigma factor/RNA polymerase sigma factor
MSVSTILLWAKKASFPRPLPDSSPERLFYRPREVAAFCTSNGIRRRVDLVSDKLKRRREKEERESDAERQRRLWLPCTEEEKAIAAAAAEGAAEQDLAERFGTTVPKIRGGIVRVRMEHILALPIRYMPHASFAAMEEGEEGEERALPPGTGLPRQGEPGPQPARLPDSPATPYEHDLLEPAQEAQLFLDMNYLKYRAARMRNSIDLSQPDPRLMDTVQNLLAQAQDVRNTIIMANLRLTTFSVQGFVQRGGDLPECISDGLFSLMRAVEGFDIRTGNKFSTYAIHAIQHDYSRNRKRRKQRLGIISFVSAEEAIVNASVPDHRSGPRAGEAYQERVARTIARLMGRLNEREQKIIRYRYALEPGDEPLTLEQTGNLLGVSRERIRQLEQRALSRLRDEAAARGFELSESGLMEELDA